MKIKKIIIKIFLWKKVREIPHGSIEFSWNASDSTFVRFFHMVASSLSINIWECWWIKRWIKRQNGELKGNCQEFKGKCYGY